ncbi:kisspeptin 2 [Aplochiton taeniatus]
MRILALVLVCAVTRQYGTLGASLTGFGSSEWSDTEEISEVEKRQETEDLNLCLFLRENEDQQQLICNDRLTRSKFNYNPFGLRFGKRSKAYPSNVDSTRSRTSKLLPILLYLRELEQPK